MRDGRPRWHRNQVAPRSVWTGRAGDPCGLLARDRDQAIRVDRHRAVLQQPADGALERLLAEPEQRRGSSSGLGPVADARRGRARRAPRGSFAASASSSWWACWRSDSTSLPSGRMCGDAEPRGLAAAQRGAARSRARGRRTMRSRITNRPMSGSLRQASPSTHSSRATPRGRPSSRSLDEHRAGEPPACGRGTARSAGARRRTAPSTARRTAPAAPCRGPSRRTRRCSCTSVTSRNATSPSVSFGIARGRDRAILGVEVDEHLDRVAGRAPRPAPRRRAAG